MIRRIVLPMFTVLIAALVATGCGAEDTAKGSDTGGKSAAKTSTPAPLKAGGDFLFCTDVPYPPAEYLEGDTFVGYEVDIVKEVGKRLGVNATFQKTGFDGIIAALQTKKCDGIISSMNSTEERKKAVDFVDYMMVGQSLLVPAGKAADITSLESLAGETVAVQVGTTLKDTIEKASADLDEPITVQTFPDAGAAATALQTGKVDAFFTDSPVAADYVNKRPDVYAFGGEPIDPLPVGIAIRKTDTELRDAVQKAIDDMYEDGTMKKILDKWNAADFMLEKM
jgi:polar amino acid transport system substrate-binding protein